MKWRDWKILGAVIAAVFILGGGALCLAVWTSRRTPEVQAQAQAAEATGDAIRLFWLRHKVMPTRLVQLHRELQELGTLERVNRYPVTWESLGREGLDAVPDVYLSIRVPGGTGGKSYFDDCYVD